MIEKGSLTKIGEVIKPHGISGEMLCELSVDIDECAMPEYIIMEDEGIMVPFFIENLRGKSSHTSFLKLEGIDTEKQAKEFTKKEIFTDCDITMDDLTEDAQIEALIGFVMIDEHCGEIGVITDIDTSTLNTLFVVGDKLIPASEEFLISIEVENKVIRCSLPEGLLDI